MIHRIRGPGAGDIRVVFKIGHLKIFYEHPGTGSDQIAIKLIFSGFSL